jgi:hypothetical protein
MSKSIWIFLFAATAIGSGDIQIHAQSQSAEIAAFDERGAEILAKSSGGCELASACPSYRISGDGSYAYTRPGMFGGETRIYNGTLTVEDRLALSQLLTLDRLGRLEASAFGGTCPSNNDGTDYSFEIELAGRKTELHSCKNALSEDVLALLLTDLFSVFSLALTENE